jgi:hypothetical protein
LLSQYHWFWDQCIPESRLIQTPQVCVRFSFNFRHWLILFHQPTAISQRLGLQAILVTPCNPFSYPASRKGTRTAQAANASLAWTPENPPSCPTKSDMHHFQQQPHKEPTPQPRNYWPTTGTCHSTHENMNPTCNQIRNKNHTDQTRHWTQPPQISERYSWWCAGFCLPITWSPLKCFSYLFSRWDVVCLCSHRWTAIPGWMPL